MARNALLSGLLLAALALVLWIFGIFSPGTSGPDGGEGLAGEAEAGASTEALATVDPASASTGLASGAPRYVAKTKPPTIDGPRITGRVTDRAGKGIPQARVVAVPDTALKPFAAADLGTPGCAGFDAVTDAEGRFAVAATVEAPFHALAVEAAGYGPTVERNVPTYREITIVLDKGGSIVGTVTDPEGNPVVGAKLVARTLLDLYRRDVEATSGPGGAYRLDGLPAWSGRSRAAGYIVGALEVNAEGFAPLLLQLNAFEFEPGQEKKRDIVLVRGASLKGRVLDAEGDRPLAGVRVVLWSSEGQAFGGVPRASGTNAWVQAPWAARLLAETTTDADGAYSFAHLPSQGFHPSNGAGWGRRGQTMGSVGAIAPGYLPKSEEVPLVRSGATLEVDLKIRVSAVIQGRIVDAQSKPVAKATVVTEAKGLEGGTWFPPDLFPDVPQPWNWLGVGEDGKYVVAVPAERTRSVEVKVIGRYPQTGGNWNQEGDGNLTVTVTPGATVEAPDLVFGAGTKGAASLEVVAKNAEGKPVFGATVMAEPWSVVGRTDAKGLATLRVNRQPPPNDALPDGRVIVSAPGHATWYGPLSASALGGVAIEATLKPGRTLSGRVLREDGLPAAKARVSVGDGNRSATEVFPTGPNRGRPPPSAPGTPNPTYSTTQADAEGKFLVEDLPEGPYHLAAWPSSSMGLAPGGPPAMGLASNVATGATEVEIRLPASANVALGGLEVRVVDAGTKRPVPGLLGSLQRPGETSMSQGFVSPPMMPGNWNGERARGGGVRGLVTSPGFIEFADVAAGTWNLVLSAEGFRPLTIENVVIRGGDVTKPAQVEMDRGIRVRGRVRVSGEGITLKDRNLTFSEIGAVPGKVGSAVSIPLDPDGTFTATGFTAGAWRVMSSKLGYGEAPEPLLVPPYGQALVLREGDGDVTFDATLLAAGLLQISLNDERLPAPPWQQQGQPANEEAARFGKATKILVRAADGTLLAEQVGVSRQNAGQVQAMYLPPGSYVVRYEAPGDTAREETVAVKTNEQTVVVVAKAGITTTWNPLNQGQQPMRMR